MEKYKGYGYHGGGRKKLDPADKKQFKTISISGTPEEIEKIKLNAKLQNKYVSKYIIDMNTGNYSTMAE